MSSTPVTPVGQSPSTQPAHGSSLADSYTNVFVLGELSGLRWRRYTHQQPSNQTVADDLLLRAFGRCAHDQLLCAWRRTPPILLGAAATVNVAANKLEALRLDVVKELIVFWYGNALPDKLDGNTSGLTLSVDCSQGWKDIDYDTRCMLFHAWHNTLQRYFEMDGYVRMGRWFVRPLDAHLATNEHGAPAHLTAFRLSFTLQEVHICVSATTQRQPVIHQLGERHIQYAMMCKKEAGSKRLNVVLAPWSVSASLVGPSNSRDRTVAHGGPWSTERPSGSAMRKMWNCFHPSLLTRGVPGVDAADESDDDMATDAPWTEVDDILASSPSKKRQKSKSTSSLLGPMVEVEVSGVRMHYPTSFVCVQRSEDKTLDGGVTRPTRKSSDSAAQQMAKTHAERKVDGLLVLQRSVESNVTAGAQSTGKSLIGQNRSTWHLSDCLDRMECCCASTSFANVRTTIVRRRPTKGAATALHRMEKQQRPTPPTSTKTEEVKIGVLTEATNRDANGHQMISPPLQTDVKPRVDNVDDTESGGKPAPGKRKYSQIAQPSPSSKELQNTQYMNALGRRLTHGVEGDASRIDVKLHNLSINRNRPRLSRVDARLFDQSSSRSCLYVNKRGNLNAVDLDEPDWAQIAEEAAHVLSHENPASIESMIKSPLTSLLSDGHDDDASHNFMSPPASNEGVHTTEGPIVTRRVPLGRVSGPISAAEVDYIYPTPPSVDPIYMSPENIPRIPSIESRHDKSAFAHAPPTTVKLEAIVEEGEEGDDKYGIFQRRKENSIIRALGDEISSTFDAAQLRGTALSRKRGSRLMAALCYTPKQSVPVVLPRPTTLNMSVGRQTAPTAFPTPVSQPTPLQQQLQQPLLPLPSSAMHAGIPFAAHQHANSMLSGGGGGGPPPRAPPPMQRPSGSGPPHYANVMSPYGPSQAFSPYQSHGQMVQQGGMPIQSPHSITRMHGQPSSVDAGWHHQHSVGSSVHPSVHQSNIAQQPEADSLLFSILLCDTPLDLFHDVNFDMCPVCVCNSGSIRGNEAGHYVAYTPAMHQQLQQQQQSGMAIGQQMMSPTANVRCTCAFSAVRHRAVSQQSGAFIEDELEATGDTSLWDSVRRQPGHPIDKRFVELIREQSVHRDIPSQLMAVSYLERQCTEALLQRGHQIFKGQAAADYKYWKLDMIDVKQVMMLALDCAVRAVDCALPTMRGTVPFSLWAYHKATKELMEPTETDTMYILSCIRDTLALHLAGNTSLASLYANKSAPSIDHGPLTWRQFESKISPSHKQEVQLCRPEPVPSIVVRTVDHEYIAMSPHGLRLWDRLMLQPYSTPKDVLYLAIVPDSQPVLRRARVFFDAVSKTYEQHRFGRHLPLLTDKSAEKSLPVVGGLTRVGITAVDTGDKENSWQREATGRRAVDVEPDPWFDDDDHPNGLMYEMKLLDHLGKEQRDELLGPLRAYARVCRSIVPAILAADAAFDRSTFTNSLAAWQRSQEEHSTGDMPPPFGGDANLATLAAERELMKSDMPPPLPHCIQIYMVDPFNCGPLNRHVRLSRLITQSLNRCYLSIIHQLGAQHAVQVPLQTMLDVAGVSVDFAKDAKDTAISLLTDPGRTVALRSTLPRQSCADAVRQMCMNVYCETRALTAEHVVRAGPGGKSLTGMGPIADRVRELRKSHYNQLGEELTNIFYRYACIPYALAPHNVHAPLIVNIPPNSKRSASDILASQTLLAPNDGSDSDHVLMVSYCLSDNQRWLLATATNARGTIMETCMVNMHEFYMKDGENGERVDPKTLPNGISERLYTRRGNVIREALNRLWSFVLAVLSTGCHPWRLVIGRVGRIGHGELKVWSQLLKSPAKFGTILKEKCAQCKGMPMGKRTHTPADQPCIISACLVAIEPEPNLRILPSEQAPTTNGRPTSSVHARPDVSTTHIVVVRMSACVNDPTEVAGDEAGEDFDFFSLLDDMEEGPADPMVDMLTAAPGGVNAKEMDTMESQPLAVGYYISTAPAAGMPTTWWTQCDAARRQSPVHLRASLHVRVNASDMSDDQLTQSSGASRHVLDTTMPSDVLRWVLERYNALSWLNVDMMTGERRSCLPIHIQTLMNMNRSVMVLVPVP